ncbi:MAG: hypothetical protein M1834_004725 [Cirrosporium novae-zelandiae]|nr:MAG: hypothetical protein M1834_004725 [Cirrosporium novae-zelandiae]
MATEEQTFDYVIVGGGTAGCVLASRLSSSMPDASILLIEAGPRHDSRTLPGVGGYVPTCGDKTLEWENMSTPQAALGGSSIPLPGGKILGGSSAINYTAWTRGPSVDFDQWAEHVGDDRWSWKGLLPYFRRSETFIPSLEMKDCGPIDLKVHGDSGPIKVSHVTNSGKPRKYPLRDKIKNLYESMGLQRNEDHNSGTLRGYSEMALSNFDGMRQYAGICYPLGSGVTVWTETRTDRLIIVEKHVKGVVCSSIRDSDQDPKQTLALARNEVIVSCGSFGSPKLLMLSGIGPSSELHKHSITPIADLPVGQTLTDHPCLTSFWELSDHHASLGDVEPVTPECNWMSGIPCDWFAFLPIDSDVVDMAKKELDAKAAERYLTPGKALTESFYVYGHFPNSPTTAPPPTKTSVLTLYTNLFATITRGILTLPSSSNPALSPPQIDPKLLSSPLDRTVLYSCIRANHRALRSFPDLVTHEYGIPDELQGDDSDEALGERLRLNGGVTHHSAGTCAMGTVVDAECRVRGGVRGLRIVDASVVPVSVSAHLQAVVYAIAEQAADMIIASAAKEKYN